MNISTINKIYIYMSQENDYVDLPEVEVARKKLKAYLMENIFSGDDEEAHKQWVGMDKEVADYGIEYERQGFIYGFRYAVDLLVRGEEPCSKGKLDERISDEYATLTVEKIDRTNPVVEILKEYVPEDKFGDTVDTLCKCLDETKYAVFEQGFLRGIAAEKGGNI